MRLISCSEFLALMPDEREKQVLADWAGHPGHQVMRQQLLEARETYYTQLGKTLYAQPDELTAADLRNKSAFFRGALWILNQPVFAAKSIERELALAGKDTDGENE